MTHEKVYKIEDNVIHVNFGQIGDLIMELFRHAEEIRNRRRLDLDDDPDV